MALQRHPRFGKPRSGTCCPAKYDDLLSWTLPSSQAIRWRHKSMLSKIHWWMVLRFDSKVHEGCMVDGCVPQIVYRRRLLALSTYHWPILILGLKNTSNVSTWSLVSSVRLKATSITSHANSLDTDLRQPVAYDSMCYTAIVSIVHPINTSWMHHNLGYPKSHWKHWSVGTVGKE